MNCCKLNLSQDKFIPRIAWVIDRRNSSLGRETDFDVEDPADTEGNKAVVSRLLSCKRPLVLRDEKLPTQELAKGRFASQVMPFIKEDMIAKALLAVFHTIYLDSTIENGHMRTFRENIGMNKYELSN